MDSFAAIAEPTRRAILERLVAHGSMTATDICRGFKCSAPAISQHLKVLKEANLVRVEKRAQQRIYYINPKPMRELEKWIKQFADARESEFSRLDTLLEKMKAEEPMLPFEEYQSKK